MKKKIPCFQVSYRSPNESLIFDVFHSTLKVYKVVGRASGSLSFLSEALPH
jgi:hypothetical protein